MTDDAPFEPPDWLDREDEVLAPYAMRTRQSRGRAIPRSRTPFAPSISATATASSTPPPFAGSCTRRRCSSPRPTTITARA